MTALLLESLLKSSVLLGTGLLLRLAWRRPALRHMTLATVLTGALALPAAIALLPAWSPPGLLQASWKTEAGDDLDASAMASVGAPIGPRAALDVTPTTGSQLLAGLRLPPTWTLWMIGVGLALVPSIAGRLRRTRLVRTALPLSRGRARRVARLVGKELGIRHEVRLLAAREEMLPATWGSVRPRVVLPAAAAGWSSHRLQTVLRHELAHVARHDALFRGLAEACCALLWFQPLSWMAARRLRLDQELACDAMVVAVGTDRHDYARELLAIAREHRTRRVAPAALAMARPSSIERRLQAIIHPLSGTATMTTTRSTILLLALAALTLPLAALSPTRAAQARHQPEAAGEAQQQRHEVGQPERSYISWDAPDMQIVVERSGELLLGSELEDLRLSPGGTLRIRGWRDANGADGDRSQPSDLQFEARADESGHTTVRWLIAGVEQSLDAEARAWVVAAVAHLQEHDRRRDVERSQAERQRDRTQELEERQRDIEAAQMERRARLELEQVEVGSSSAPRRVQVLPEVRVKMIPEVKVLPEIQPDTEAIVAAQLPVLSRVTVVPIVTPEAVSLARVTVGTSARRWGPGWKWIGSHAADGTRLEIGYRGEFDWADSLDALKLPQDAEILMIERTPDGGVRSLAAEPGPDGLMLTWTIAGERHPVDDTVRAWAAEMLGRLLRRE